MTLLLAGMALSAGTAFAQKQVTGTVVDTDGEPVIGANVIVEGTGIGVTTDNNGRFVIKTFLPRPSDSSSHTLVWKRRPSAFPRTSRL